MELQQQGGIPGYGHYRSLYNQGGGGGHDPAGFRGGGHLGYPFPPMPGQYNGGYPHLYPSSQSPGPREGRMTCRDAESGFRFVRHMKQEHLVSEGRSGH